MRSTRDGYELDPTLTADWFALPAGRGFAGYGLARALRMLLDLLAGLTALHETRSAEGSGFVHGELVPGLVRVDAQGIARLQPLAPWQWQTVEAAISPHHLGHLAPERLLGDAIDRRADVYSAGVLLWEALAGKRLFEQDSVDEIVTRLMGGKVLLPELPPELAWAIPLKAVAMRALSVDPAQRFADCPALAAAIEAVARRQVASHAMVAAHFGAPARGQSSLPPPPPRVPFFDEAYRASHKSSLSALVAPSGVQTRSATPPPAELEFVIPPKKGKARRVAWTVTALLSLAVALGAVAFPRHTATYVVAREAAAGWPVASVVASAPAPAASVASEPSAPSAAAPRAVDADVPLGVSEVAGHPPRVLSRGREKSGRAAPKPRPAAPALKPAAAAQKPAAPAQKPAAPAAAPRTEAEQYGI